MFLKDEGKTIVIQKKNVKMLRKAVYNQSYSEYQRPRRASFLTAFLDSIKDRYFPQSGEDQMNYRIPPEERYQRSYQYY